MGNAGGGSGRGKKETRDLVGSNIVFFRQGLQVSTPEPLQELPDWPRSVCARSSHGNAGATGRCKMAASFTMLPLAIGAWFAEGSMPLHRLRRTEDCGPHSAQGRQESNRRRRKSQRGRFGTARLRTGRQRCQPDQDHLMAAAPSSR